MPVGLAGATPESVTATARARWSASTTSSYGPRLLRTRFRMKLRRQGAMGECEARTQEALVAALRVRPRTMHRAAQCALGGRSFILNRVVSQTRLTIAPMTAHSASMQTIPPWLRWLSASILATNRSGRGVTRRQRSREERSYFQPNRHRPSWPVTKKTGVFITFDPMLLRESVSAHSPARASERSQRDLGGGRVLLDSPDEFLGDSPAHQAASCSLRSVDQ